MRSLRPSADLLALLAIPLVLLVLFPMDLAPGRFLVTYGADQFEPWGPPKEGASFNSDCLRSYYPRRVHATEALREGRVPLWDPSSFCGQPFLANFQSGVFYPVNLLLLPLSPERSLGVSVWIHLVIAASGAMLLFRGLSLSRGASLIGGLLYAASGALAVRSGQVTMLATAAWIPFVLHASARTIRGGGVLPLAVSYAFLVLAGFPPILLWATLLALSWTLHEWLGVRRERGSRPLLRAGEGFVLGAGLAAVQLVPTAEFLLHTDRIRFTYESLVSSAWHPAAVIRLLVPDWFGSPIDGDSWIELLKRGDGHYYQSYLSTAAYLGIGTLLLVSSGAAAAWRNRSARFLMVAGAAALLVLLGTPALRLVSILPGLAGARVDRIVYLVAISLLVPAAFGVERSGRGGAPGRSVPVAALFLGALLALLWFGREEIAGMLAQPDVRHFLDSGLDARRMGWAVLFLAGSSLLLLLPSRVRTSRFYVPLLGLLLVADAGFQARRCHVTVGKERLPAETEETRFLRGLGGEGRIVRFRDSVLPPSLPGLFGLEDVEGYNALTIKDYRAYYEALSPESVKERRINPLVEPASLSSPLLGLLGARWVLSERALPGEFPLLYRGRFGVYENPRALPRAYLAREIYPATGDPARTISLLAAVPSKSLPAVAEEEFPPLPEGGAAEETVGEWLAGHGGVETALGGATPLEDTAWIAMRDPERVVVDCASRGARMLVLSDSYYPGWKAAIDGESAPILRVNRIFRGVIVPAGAHRVVFTYRPPSFFAGAALSLLAIAALAFRSRSKPLRAPGESR